MFLITQFQVLMNNTALIWNVRGIGNKATVNSLKQLVQAHNISVVAISEPRVPLSQASNVARKIRLSKVIGNRDNTSKIWLFHSCHLELQVIERHAQYLTVAHIKNNKIISFLTVVYASCDMIIRRDLFDSLMQFSRQVNVPWLIGGDFNCIASTTEKMGGSFSSTNAMTDFQGFMSATGFADAGFTGSKFTWTNNQVGPSHINARLDRVLLNPYWVQSGIYLAVKHLTRGPSDHAPLLLSMIPASPAPGRFMYQQMWHSHDDFKRFVRDQWNMTFHLDSNPFYNLQLKLRTLKIALRQWNKDVFGNINLAKESASVQLAESQSLFDNNPTLENRQKLQQANALMNSILEKEEIFWYQKSRVKWLSYGDKNTSYFHQYVKVRRQQNYVHRLKINDAWVEDQETILNGAVQFFQNLLKSDPHYIDEDLLSPIPQLISDDQNKMLCAVPQKAEIQSAVFSLAGNSSPGPDGFSGIFYTHCWEIIEDDVVKAVQSFFQGWGLPQGVTSSILCLIPKLKSPSSFTDFRPISLCNFSYKIVSKVICDRMRDILPLIISSEQSGFVHGRQIIENCSLAQEMFAELHRPIRGHNMLVKLDMAKAYDRVEWDFLYAVLKKFGFSSRFVSLLAQMVSNCWFSISLNGVSRGYFKSSRGVRQGDPLAPALFIIAEEVLSRGISLLFSRGVCKYYHLPRGVQEITHLLFADDSMVFLNGGLPSINNLLLFLAAYEDSSGQKINAQKSCFVVSKHMPRSAIDRIITKTGFQHRIGSISYLGIPLISGRQKVIHFKFLIDKILAKLEGWQSSLLSQAGRLTLIRSVLDSFTVYSASATSIPHSILRRIESICSNFFWQGYESTHRKHWISWDKICRPVAEGGLGIRNLYEMKISLYVKLLWNSLYSNSLWANFIRSKYIAGKHISDCKKPFPVGFRTVDFERARSVLLSNSRKVVMSGASTNFLKDSWLIDKPLLDTFNLSIHSEFGKCSVQEVLSDPTHGIWQLPISRHLMDTARNYILYQRDDIPVWTLTNSGQYSSKSTYVFLMDSGSRQSGQISKLWNSAFPIRASLFCWRLLKQAVPVDSQVQSCGVQLASSCVCCRGAHSVEDLDHLFIHGEIAKVFWSAFSPLLPSSWSDIPHIRNRLHTALIDSVMSCPKDVVALLVMELVIWHIWKIRCSIKNDNSWRPLDYLAELLVEDLQILLKRIRFKQEFGRDFYSKLQAFGLVANSPKILFIIVRWKYAEFGYTLNVDGASKGNPGLAGGGGCIRDPRGQVCLGFSYFYGFGTNTVAEGRALLDGLRLAQLHNISISAIYTDSMVLLMLIQSKQSPPWSFLPWWEALTELISHFHCPIRHVYREGNQLADALANHAVHVGHNQEFAFLQDLPQMAKGYAISDANGLPNFRKRIVQQGAAM